MGRLRSRESAAPRTANGLNPNGLCTLRVTRPCVRVANAAKIPLRYKRSSMRWLTHPSLKAAEHIGNNEENKRSFEINKGTLTAQEVHLRELCTRC